jgi:hypothetical protein
MFLILQWSPLNITSVKYANSSWSLEEKVDPFVHWIYVFPSLYLKLYSGDLAKPIFVTTSGMGKKYFRTIDKSDVDLSQELNFNE